MTVGATVTAGGTTGNLNVCNPDPLFKIATSSGNQRVTVNVPSGWTATNGTFRDVTVPSGSYYSFTIEQWFGIKRNVVASTLTLTPQCNSVSGEAEIKATWGTPSGQPAYNNYQVAVQRNGGPVTPIWTKDRIPTGSNPTTVTAPTDGFTATPGGSKLANLTSYTVKVSTENFTSFGPFTNTIVNTPPFATGNVTTLDCAGVNPPEPTQTVNCDSTTGSITATLSWTAGVGGNNFRAEIGQGGAIPAAYFSKAVSGAPGTSVPVGFVPAGTTPAGSALTLSQNTDYTYRIIYNNGSYSAKTAGPKTFNTGPCAGTPPYDNVLDLGGGATCQSVLQNSDFEIFPVDARNRGTGSSPSITVEVDGGHDGSPGGPASAWITANTVDTTGSPTVLSSPLRYRWSAGSPPPGNVPFFSQHAWWHVGAAPIGTTIYFNGRVSPGKGIDGGVITDAFHDATYGGGVLPCITVVSTTSPYFTTTGSDVHAGGSAGSGSNCTLSVAGTGNIRGQVNQDGGSPADYPTKVEYVVSAHGNINNVGGDGLQFSNIPFAPGPGHYGSVCRPDLVNLALKYPAASTSTYVPGTSNLGGVRANDTMFKHVGDVTLTAPVTIAGRVTLFVQGNITIKGNINFNAGPWAWSPDPALNNLPALGIIATGDINIDPAVTHLDGYFFAGGAGGPGGVFDTCAGVVISGPGATASVCSNELVLNGLVMASKFRLARTRGTTVPGTTPAETFNFLGDIYLTPPPVFRDAFTARATGLQFQGELPPLY